MKAVGEEYYNVVRYVKRHDETRYVLYRIHDDNWIARMEDCGWKATIIDTFTEYEFARDHAAMLNRAVWVFNQI